jgi:glycosyltransferase involved in cell wall biosynthesis
VRVLILGDAFFVPIVNLSRFLVNAGHDVHLATIRGGTTPLGVTRHEIRGAGRLGILFARGAVGKLVAAIQPDVVHAFYLTSYGFLATGARGVPILASATGTDLFGAPELAAWLGPLRRRLGRIAVRGASHVHSVAEHMNARLIEWGANPAAITTFPRGIDLARFRFAPRSDIAAPPIRVLCNRKLEPVYDPEPFVRALGIVKRRGVHLRASMAGDGPMRSRVVEWIREEDLGREVTLEGFVGEERLRALHRASDLYVSLSRSDSTSQSLLEAMASGVLPIVTDIAGNREWVTHRRDGYLVPVGDAEAVACAIEEAARDPDRESMAARARAAVLERASFEDTVTMVEEKLRAL